MDSPPLDPDQSRDPERQLFVLSPSPPPLQWLESGSSGSLSWPSPLQTASPYPPPLSPAFEGCPDGCAHCIAEAEASSSAPQPPHYHAHARHEPHRFVLDTAAISAAVSAELARAARPPDMQLQERQHAISPRSVHRHAAPVVPPPAAAWQTDVTLSWLDPAPADSLPAPTIEHDPATCPHCRSAAEGDSKVSLLSPASTPSLHRPSLPPSRTFSSSTSVLHPPSPPASPTMIEHRRSDASRRLRERTALDRLDELSSTEAELPQQLTALSADTTDVSVPRRKRKRDKRDKLTVLEACAVRIERLEKLLSEAEQSNTVLTAELGVLVAREHQSAQWLDASKTLDSACLLSDRFFGLLFDSRTGTLLYANASFFTTTGFTPGGVLQRVMNRIDPSSPTGHKPQEAGLQYPLVRAQPGQALSVEQEDGSKPSEWVARKPAKQYPRTLQLFADMFAGRVASFRVTLRSRFANGQVYELHRCDFWVVESELAEDADGRRWRRPVSYASRQSVDEIVEVGSD